MARIFIQPQFRDLTNGESEIEIAASTLRQLVVELERRFPGLENRIVRDGRIRPGMAVSIDGVITSRGLTTTIHKNSEVHFVPAIGGG